MSSSWIVKHTKSIFANAKSFESCTEDYGRWRGQQILPQILSPTVPEIVGASNFDWSNTGRGRHVNLQLNEAIPGQTGRFLGRGASSEVHETRCLGTAFALKKRRIARRNMRRELRAFVKEEANMGKVGSHNHIAKIVGTFRHPKMLGILMWPAAVCDLGTYFDDLDPLWQLYMQAGRQGCVDRSALIRSIDVDAIARLKTLQVLQTDENDQCTFFPAYLRLERSFGCLAGAIAYLHRHKIKHKDLKPANILLTAGNIFVTDFGTSTDFSANAESATESWAGTPKYFAPEVALYQPSGRAADVFSLGCIFLEMAYVHCGESLEKLQDLRSLRGRSYEANIDMLPAWLENIHFSPNFNFKELIVDMLSIEPRQRPSASEVVERLHAMRKEVECNRLTRKPYRDALFGHAALFGACCASTFRIPMKLSFVCA